MATYLIIGIGVVVFVVGIIIGKCSGDYKDYDNFTKYLPPLYDYTSQWDYNFVKSRNSQLEAENYTLRKEFYYPRYFYPSSCCCEQTTKLVSTKELKEKMIKLFSAREDGMLVTDWLMTTREKLADKIIDAISKHSV